MGSAPERYIDLYDDKSGTLSRDSRDDRSRHVGCGLTDDEVEKHELKPHPDHRPLIPETIEEEIVTFADLFYSKNETFLLRSRTAEEARAGVARFGSWSAQKLDTWVKKFES